MFLIPWKHCNFNGTVCNIDVEEDTGAVVVGFFVIANESGLFAISFVVDDGKFVDGTGDDDLFEDGTDDDFFVDGTDDDDLGNDDCPILSLGSLIVTD